MKNNLALKGGSFTLSVLHLLDDDLNNAIKALKKKILQAPAFFDNAPMVVDISNLKTIPDFEKLKFLIEQIGMRVVGISGCKKNDTREAVKKAGLALMNPGNLHEHESARVQTPTKVITRPIRSGQQVYAKDSDLVILNHVSAGAEIIADGSIHIYGVLRGRAIAGANGQSDARIFCQNLQSELLSISGTYLLSETIPEEYSNRPVKISLKDNSLNIEYITP